MSFIKRGDPEKIIHILKKDEVDEDKVKTAIEQSGKNLPENGNKNDLDRDVEQN